MTTDLNGITIVTAFNTLSVCVGASTIWSGVATVYWAHFAFWETLGGVSIMYVRNCLALRTRQASTELLV